MQMKEFKLILNNVLLALQLLLGFWQFMKLTPVGALIQGVVGWVLRRFGLSPAHTRLQYLPGRVFKQVNCFVLQAEIPSERRGIEADSPDSFTLSYLKEEFFLERRGNMLFIDGKMCYYITPTIWQELLTFGRIFNVPFAAADASTADAAAAFFPAAAAADPSLNLSAVFLKGQREFWEGISTGGVMTLAEALDGVILYNQHVSVLLNDHTLLPVNLSVSELKLLKIINLVGLFLQTKKDRVHWLIPTTLSAIAAMMEFNATLRVWLYSNINMLFCYIMHSICDPLPLSWRRQVYSLGKWVDNLKPSNDIQLKIQRGTKCAIIAAGAKVDKENATLMPWLNLADEEHSLGVIHKQFPCNSIHIDMVCSYYVGSNRCSIWAPTISTVYVDCKSIDEFRHIITFVSCMAKNGSGSLKTCGRNNKVSVRGFRESLFSYVKNGCPPVYELELENVVLI